MTQSMTGYSRSELTLGDDTFIVEVKSLNHRYLEINNRSPERFFPQDIKIREFIKSKFARGAFSVNISFSKKQDSNIKLNLPLAKSYIDASLEIKKNLGLEGELTIESIMRLKDILSGSDSSESDIAKDWEGLKTALESACSELAVMRETEGGKLKSDIIERLDTVLGFNSKVETMTDGAVDKYMVKITDRIKELTSVDPDDQRIITEAALLADKTSITEEIVRLGIHINKMKEFLNSSESSGRKCDFLCQELLREINTVGSKTDNADVTIIVVEAKGELEKIREQVQNIE